MSILTRLKHSYLPFPIFVHNFLLVDALNFFVDNVGKFCADTSCAIGLELFQFLPDLGLLHCTTQLVLLQRPVTKNNA